MERFSLGQAEMYASKIQLHYSQAIQAQPLVQPVGELDIANGFVLFPDSCEVSPVRGCILHSLFWSTQAFDGGYFFSKISSQTWSWMVSIYFNPRFLYSA